VSSLIVRICKDASFTGVVASKKVTGVSIKLIETYDLCDHYNE